MGKEFEHFMNKKKQMENYHVENVYVALIIRKM